MEKSFDFYTKLLQEEPIYKNEDRWVTFVCGNTISLYNKRYAERLLKDANNECFNQALSLFFTRWNTDTNPVVSSWLYC